MSEQHHFAVLVRLPRALDVEDARAFAKEAATVLERRVWVIAHGQSDVPVDPDPVQRPTPVEEIQVSGWDEDGYHFGIVHGDYGAGRFRITSVEAARALLLAADGIRGWVEEYDSERAAYERATPEERSIVIGRTTSGRALTNGDIDDLADEAERGYDPADFRKLSEAEVERLREKADLGRKADRENQ